ncbi:lytic transglycosylase domain-containing protein [Citrobacter koseri]|uniref:lytic transglycosylase domain-containing protein n=1 Tax=Citrobacter koseri TaxID=545 RepID=UPI001F2841AE|nr:lytic transglycosylase domain-containing protein [Citrobacter koseri]MDM9067058.1 lytic transglycosylase domain-containing protein [Citrobacter koseri]MDM9081484.1 lytic transglycosylase domain-containing protein [Citrobacter koseri]MDM9090129.1 lytic transglycosylase domain-containing protein [Citrobacter koseri]MDM9095534.1 lytic transglycosylase domain-containing protein [Citrobacter koseri]MDM9269849.1 lytic transglycosylase domain-containing protein [Citrobacter koseri]
MANRRILKLACGLWFACSNCLAGTTFNSSNQAIPQAYREIAAAERVPAESLYSLAMAETTRKTAWGTRPWPWTINVAGKGYHYETREEAFEALLGFMQRYPLKRIDVGVAQVNLGWNGHFFPSFRDAFDPYINLRAAARILRSCYDAKPGSWIRAAGCYHHPAGGQPAAKYMAIVRRKLSQITPEIKVPDGEPVVLASHSLTWVEPQ